MREELARERQSCEDLKQKLTVAEKELKSSAVMNLELEDYQRSMKTLEEQLMTRSSELERVRKDGQLQHDSMMQLKKDLGKAVQLIIIPTYMCVFQCDSPKNVGNGLWDKANCKSGNIHCKKYFHAIKVQGCFYKNLSYVRKFHNSRSTNIGSLCFPAKDLHIFCCIVGLTYQLMTFSSGSRINFSSGGLFQCLPYLFIYLFILYLVIFVISELMDEQRSQSEETVAKLKQLLMRNKKELGESKKKEGELQQTIQELHSKMEAEKQIAESAKVTPPYIAQRVYIIIILCRELYISAGRDISNGCQNPVTAKPGEHKYSTPPFPHPHVPPPPHSRSKCMNKTVVSIAFIIHCTFNYYVGSLSHQWKPSIARYTLWSISWVWPRESWAPPRPLWPNHSRSTSNTR